MKQEDAIAVATEEAPDARVSQDGQQHEPSLGHSFARLGHAVRTFADAEIVLAKKRGAIIGSASLWIALLAAVALAAVFGTIVTLMIGAVLALAPHWGLGLSLLAVTGGAIFAILLCALGIKGQIARIREGVR